MKEGEDAALVVNTAPQMGRRWGRGSSGRVKSKLERRGRWRKRELANIKMELGGEREGGTTERESDRQSKDGGRRAEDVPIGGGRRTR